MFQTSLSLFLSCPENIPRRADAPQRNDRRNDRLEMGIYIADGENTTNSCSSLIFLQPRVPINKQLGDDESSCVIRIPLPNSWTLVESVDFASPAFSSV